MTAASGTDAATGERRLAARKLATENTTWSTGMMYRGIDSGAVLPPNVKMQSVSDVQRYVRRLRRTNLLEPWAPGLDVQSDDRQNFLRGVLRQIAARVPPLAVLRPSDRPQAPPLVDLAFASLGSRWSPSPKVGTAFARELGDLRRAPNVR